MAIRLLGNRRTRQTHVAWDEDSAQYLNAIFRSHRRRSQQVSAFVIAPIPHLVTPRLYYYRLVPADFRGQTSADSGPSAELRERDYKMDGSHIRSGSGPRLSLWNQCWAWNNQGIH